jgi:hypothetical protein
METQMQIELLAIGIQIGAMALILGSFVLFLTGASGSLGGSFRSFLEPKLRWARDRTSLSRQELADRTILVAAALAVAAAVVETSVLAALMAIGLWLARPSIARLTGEENRMLAVAGYFSIDLMIGLYTPIMLAQFLLADILLGACLFTVVVALSWPAGGGGSSIPGRRWQLAPVIS